MKTTTHSHPFSIRFFFVLFFLPDAEDCLTNGPESILSRAQSWTEQSIWQMRKRAGRFSILHSAPELKNWFILTRKKQRILNEFILRQKATHVWCCRYILFMLLPLPRRKYNGKRRASTNTSTSTSTRVSLGFFGRGRTSIWSWVSGSATPLSTFIMAFCQKQISESLSPRKCACIWIRVRICIWCICICASAVAVAPVVAAAAAAAVCCAISIRICQLIICLYFILPRSLKLYILTRPVRSCAMYTFRRHRYAFMWSRL